VLLLTTFHQVFFLSTAHHLVTLIYSLNTFEPKIISLSCT
jgi:hypothetical protein